MRFTPGQIGMLAATAISGMVILAACSRENKSQSEGTPEIGEVTGSGQGRKTRIQRTRADNQSRTRITQPSTGNPSDNTTLSLVNMGETTSATTIGTTDTVVASAISMPDPVSTNPVSNVREIMAKIDLNIADKLPPDQSLAVQSRVNQILLGFQREYLLRGDREEAEIDNEMGALNELVVRAEKAGNREEYLDTMRELNTRLNALDTSLTMMEKRNATDPLYRR